MDFRLIDSLMWRQLVSVAEPVHMYGLIIIIIIIIIIACEGALSNNAGV